MTPVIASGDLGVRGQAQRDPAFGRGTAFAGQAAFGRKAPSPPVGFHACNLKPALIIFPQNERAAGQSISAAQAQDTLAACPFASALAEGNVFCHGQNLS